MAARIGWTRKGSKRRFRYFDADGREITDEQKLERVRALAIPPAWKDVWISASARSKLQATGVDAAGRKQYLYHPDYRAKQEQAKYDKLIRFAERLPQLRAAMAEHMELDGLPPEKVAAIATRLINLGWFRVGGDRYAKKSRTFGITTLRKSHVAVRGSRVSFRYRGKHSIMLRSAIVDAELAAAIRELAATPGTRLFASVWVCGGPTCASSIAAISVPPHVRKSFALNSSPRYRLMYSLRRRWSRLQRVPSGCSNWKSREPGSASRSFIAAASSASTIALRSMIECLPR